VACGACALCFCCWKRQPKRPPFVTTMPPPCAVGSTEPAAQQMLSVTVPQGSWPGQWLQVSTPCGQLLQVHVPDGVLPGQTFSVAYVPCAAAP
jgi:hypothetical protein